MRFRMRANHDMKEITGQCSAIEMTPKTEGVVYAVSLS